MSSEEMEEWVTLYGDDVYRFCFHLTGKREETEDLYQDTFVKAVQLSHRLDRSGNVKSYLMGIAANLWKNQLRKNGRRREILPQVSYEEVEYGTKAVSNLLEDYLTKELKMLLMEVVDLLPEKQKVVVLLHYTQDYTASEIAEILHIPRGTVLSRLAKARAKIRSELEGRGYEV